MKKIVIEDAQEGFLKLLGEYITVYCESFIYAGNLTGVNEDCILLSNASIVYDVGAHSKKEFELEEKLPGEWYIQKNKVESFGIFKNGK